MCTSSLFAQCTEVYICIFYVIVLLPLAQPRVGISKPTTFSLNDELKKVLHFDRKERVHACGDRSVFQFLFSCFHNYEVCGFHFFKGNMACIYMCVCVCVCVCVCMK